MMEREHDLREILTHLDPGECTYTEWAEVGMALKHEGYSVRDWDDWSARDVARYHPGECEKKWESFRGSSTPVTGGTIFQMAVDRGWEPRGNVKDGFMGWNDSFIVDGRVIDPEWVEARDVKPPRKWEPAQQMIKYLSTLFEPGETVGYVVQSYVDEKGKHIPKNKGKFKATAGELIEKLAKCNNDVGSVLDDYDPEAGAWVRFNPLDGKGVRNENVTEYRYALVESDTLPIEKQNALIRELELPVAVLVHSGGKSLHAIVRIDATDYAEYQKRVNKLYDVCRKNGLEIDKQNRNPSRLSRLPGCTRGKNKQYIVDTNIGKDSWNEWSEWIDSIDDNLPDFENLSDVWNDMPDKRPELISGVLREGHKMLIVGGSKTGKSFLQIELCISIAEGRDWLGWKCTQGRVLYVNLELDRASCLHRFRDVYAALLGTDRAPKGLRYIDIWNLRGAAESMDKLTKKLIRRAKKNDYKAIIIDPIYKVLTGDENSAEQMARFCNEFDKICRDTGAAAIYCHHHSKGAQGGKKSMDRASGSGVFGRDPDALLDLIELPLDDNRKGQTVRDAQLEAAEGFIRKTNPDMLSKLPIAADCSKIEDYISAVRDQSKFLAEGEPFTRAIREAGEAAEAYTALRIDGTLREFRKFKPVNIWFKYPAHELDNTGMLQDIEPEDEGRVRRWNNLGKSGKKNKSKAELKQERIDNFSSIFAMLDMEKTGSVPLEDLADSMGVSTKTVKNRVREAGKRYFVDTDGYVHLNEKQVEK